MVLFPTPSGRPGLGCVAHGGELCDRFVAQAPTLDSIGEDPLNQHGSGGGPISLREVLVGMIQEYARHMGHVDVLRERIGGRLGQ
jgi:hypothetical protein